MHNFLTLPGSGRISHCGMMEKHENIDFRDIE